MVNNGLWVSWNRGSPSYHPCYYLAQLPAISPVGIPVKSEVDQMSGAKTTRRSAMPQGWPVMLMDCAPTEMALVFCINGIATSPIRTEQWNIWKWIKTPMTSFHLAWTWSLHSSSKLLEYFMVPLKIAIWGLFQTNPFTGWWFEPLWKILVNWDDYSQYMGK